MSSSAVSLSEPHVLARTKEALFPEDGASDTYAVVDTQFAKNEWLSGQPLDQRIRDRLSPFNHVRLGGGYPDLVGVRNLDNEFLAVERFGDEPPLIVIEAKGYDSKEDGVPTEKGITQAYDRLAEANVAYLAAPAKTITKTDRTLARELNVGVLGVSEQGTVTPIERPRVVGNRTTSDATAIRFQASAQGVADKSFSLNHPKNYLGYALACYADGDTATLQAKHVVGEVDGSRQGAEFLGLVHERDGHIELTTLGQEVVRFAKSNYETVEAALREFENWQRSRKRFIDDEPLWGQLARRIVFEYKATTLLVSILQELHEIGNSCPSLVELVTYLHGTHSTFAVELFIKGDEDVRSRVLDEDGELQTSELADGNVYHSPTVFQLKAMLYHAGIVTERGKEPNKLDPTDDVWALRELV
ncbi:hypothetical protein C479_06197 [Halovivax asiaticus JCM 14624]|uniref:Uncharacterized protein n=1 Tax=Halovivax asiaticus JCM 14624 TaxID=1227490 RepID=M0BQT9_9EURY|nr:hypothetical protein [Halovivax asiaticus]ELZ12014.1 hypothetical protein C479_06197 [Halovivax asiaticus JCM 14624]